MIPQEIFQTSLSCTEITVLGKTTILRLVFHLLGHEDDRGHRTFLAQTRFSKFLVELENGITISAERANGMLIGSYKLRMSIVPGRSQHARLTFPRLLHQGQRS